MKPSGGVIAIGVLNIIFGIIGLIFFAMFVVLWLAVGLTDASHLDFFTIVKTPFDLMLDIILIISGIGVFMLKRWARTLALICAWVAIILSIIGIIIFILNIGNVSPNAHPKAQMIGGIIGGIIGLAYPIILLIFFLRRSIKEQFVKKAEEQGNIKLTKMEEPEQAGGILQKRSTLRFENREEYEKWKVEKLRETAEATERKRDKKTADPEVLTEPEPKQSAANLVGEDLSVSQDTTELNEPMARANAEHPTEKGKAVTKSSKIVMILILIVLFGILVVHLITDLGPFWRMLDRGIVSEYSRRLTETTTIFQEHDALNKKSLETAASKDLDALDSFAKEYSEKTARWGSSLNESKLFIQANDGRIRRVGINPDSMRDNINETLRLMKENEVRFHKEVEEVKKQTIDNMISKEMELNPKVKELFNDLPTFTSTFMKLTEVQQKDTARLFEKMWELSGTGPPTSGSGEVSQVEYAGLMSEVKGSYYELTIKLENGNRAVISYPITAQYDRVKNISKGSHVGFKGRLKTIKNWGFWASVYILGE